MILYALGSALINSVVHIPVRVERGIDMTTNGRTIFAFLLAPVSFGVLLLLLSLFLSSPMEGLWALRFSAMVGYPLAVVFGVPAYILLSKKHLNGPVPYAFLSLGFSSLLAMYFVVRPALLSGQPQGMELLSSPRIMQIAVLVFASFFSVFVFWLIARPDRTAR